MSKQAYSLPGSAGNEEHTMKLKYLATIKTNYRDADFWLVCRGDIKRVGEPTKIFSKYHIGIKLDSHKVFLPEFLFLTLKNVHLRGYWLTQSYGTLALQHIKVLDVKNLEIC